MDHSATHPETCPATCPATYPATWALDAVMIGRAGVDLYGDQIGGRLEDMGSFSKYIGGSPTNTAIGAARLGCKTALISRVGPDAMGTFIREELQREGVEVSALGTDKARMTALVVLGIRDTAQFPLVFFRENCADMALCEADIAPDLIARAKCVVTSGTHFSTPDTKAASLKALRLAAQHGAERWIDLDYRPVLWGLAEKGDGETRFITSNRVTAHLQEIMPELDVVVGTEEEIHIAGGSTDTITSLKTLRGLTDATFVVKLGALGCAVFEGPIPDTVEGGEVIAGFPIEIFNVLGAGDAFMGGLVTGRTEGKDWAEACRMANACGAFAVSRHACAPAYPSRVELETFLAEGSPHFRLREDRALEQLHWSTTRQGNWDQVLAFAFDHRSQLEELCDDPAKIGEFKELCAEVLLEVAAAFPNKQLGALCDRRLGQAALYALAGQGLWLASPIEWPGSRPLDFEGGASLASFLREWPREIVVKCLVFAHPQDGAELWAQQLAKLTELAAACRTWRLELLLEVIPPKDLPQDARTIHDCLAKIYAAGIAPDWWKLPAPTGPEAEETWAAWQTLIEAESPQCRGVLLLGLDAPLDELKATLQASKNYPLCKGFAVGRTLFGEAARAWFAGEMSAATAKANIATKYTQMIIA